MPAMNLVQAIQSALDYKLGDDERVLVFGEDAGLEGGVFRVTQGLQEKYGERRVFDTPLAESVIMGAGLGMAVAGLRPVLEIQFCGFIYPAMNQLVTHVSRMRNRSRGAFTVPLVIRLPYGGGIQALELHSESMEAMLAHIPGLKVVIPSTPYDAKGLLISAIESEDPVLFMEPKKVYRAFRQEVPAEAYRIPLGKASVVQAGTRLTLVAYGAMMRVARQAVELAAKEGLSVELIDLRSIYPLDTETLLESVKKTGRLAVLHEGPTSFGVAAEIIARVNEEALYWLEAPPRRITGFDTIMPLPMGEQHYMPTPERVLYELIQLHNQAE
ncbi:MAG: alpha-ketoacid dehydrogenase subunit beta [Candidatus Delongbacteria bacterium]